MTTTTKSNLTRWSTCWSRRRHHFILARCPHQNHNSLFFFIFLHSQSQPPFPKILTHFSFLSFNLIIVRTPRSLVTLWLLRHVESQHQEKVLESGRTWEITLRLDMSRAFLTSVRSVDPWQKPGTPWECTCTTITKEHENNNLQINIFQSQNSTPLESHLRCCEKSTQLSVEKHPLSYYRREVNFQRSLPPWWETQILY